MKTAPGATAPPTPSEMGAAAGVLAHHPAAARLREELAALEAATRAYTTCQVGTPEHDELRRAYEEAPWKVATAAARLSGYIGEPAPAGTA